MNEIDNKVGMDAFFLAGSRGRLFVLYAFPEEEKFPQTTVVVFPPFADEMNKSRRMLALQARQIAAQGISVMLVDLFGTGDSEGRFGEADWETWQADMQLAIAWLATKGIQNTIFLGIRLGAILALKTLANSNLPVGAVVFWQPIVSGQQFFNQFLRLRVAAEMIGGDANGVSTKTLRALLSSGESVEVAGYEISSRLGQKLDDLRLETGSEVDLPSVTWFEVIQNPERPVPLFVQKTIQEWKEKSVDIHQYSIVGEGFWNTPEITLIPALLNETTRAITTAK